MRIPSFSIVQHYHRRYRYCGGGEFSELQRDTDMQPKSRGSLAVYQSEIRTTLPRGAAGAVEVVVKQKVSIEKILVVGGIGLGAWL